MSPMAPQSDAFSQVMVWTVTFDPPKVKGDWLFSFMLLPGTQKDVEGVEVEVEEEEQVEVEEEEVWFGSANIQ